MDALSGETLDVFTVHDLVDQRMLLHNAGQIGFCVFPEAHLAHALHALWTHVRALLAQGSVAHGTRSRHRGGIAPTPPSHSLLLRKFWKGASGRCTPEKKCAP